MLSMEFAKGSKTGARPPDETGRQVLDGHCRWDAAGHFRQHGRGRVERVRRRVLHEPKVSGQYELPAGAAVCETVWSARDPCDDGSERVARERVARPADRGVAVDAARKLEL